MSMKISVKRSGIKSLRAAALLSLLVFLAMPATAQEKSWDKADPETMEYMRQGSAFFLKRDFKSAIGPYQKALDREKKQSTLGQTMWRVLVDNLGMAYGISGDLKKAKEIFEYGLEKEPQYPMFHYLMACTYAEMNDMDKTIVYLKQAFEYKDNMIKGEQMPDPWTDDSFQRFINDDKFVKALKELKRD
jgi:tetratricopeptide (TPR) repeat protein